LCKEATQISLKWLLGEIQKLDINAMGPMSASVPHAIPMRHLILMLIHCNWLPRQELNLGPLEYEAQPLGHDVRSNIVTNQK